MKQIYAGNKANFKMQIKSEIKWLWSEKKKKAYYKIEESINGIEYMVIGFKNDYIIVYEKGKKTLNIESVRNYYHIIKDGIAFEIIPSVEMPF